MSPSFAAIALFFCLLMPLRAALLVYDGFDYATGQNVDGQNGGTGFDSSSAWVENRDPKQDTIGQGLLYNSLATTGNGVIDNSNPTDGAFWRQLAQAIAPTSGTTTRTVWTSFLVRHDSGNSGFLLKLWTGVSGNTFSYPFVSIGGDSSGFFLYDQPPDSSPVQPQQIYADSAPTPDFGITCWLTAKLMFNVGANLGGGTRADKILLFVNPTLGTTPADSDAAATLTSQVDYSAIRAVEFSDYNDAGSGQWTFDELRIGDTFSDVTTVPEPGTCALILLGTVLTGCWFRRG